MGAKDSQCGANLNPRDMVGTLNVDIVNIINISAVGFIIKGRLYNL